MTRLCRYLPRCLYSRRARRAMPGAYAWGARQAGAEIRDLIPVQRQANIAVGCICVAAGSATAIAALYWPPVWRIFA